LFVDYLTEAFLVFADVLGLEGTKTHVQVYIVQLSEPFVFFSFRGSDCNWSICTPDAWCLVSTAAWSIESGSLGDSSSPTWHRSHDMRELLARFSDPLFLLSTAFKYSRWASASAKPGKKSRRMICDTAETYVSSSRTTLGRLIRFGAGSGAMSAVEALRLVSAVDFGSDMVIEQRSGVHVGECRW
jgi:hypothetical protein